MNSSFPIYYETLGNPENPCLLLINGLGGQLINWPLAFTEGLVNQGFYVITFDNRDTGLSRYYDEYGIPDIHAAITTLQQGKDFKPPYTLKDMASDAIALLDKLHIKKAHLVGISMGGIISQIVALEYPERILSLTCIASTSNDSTLPPAKQEVRDYLFAPQKQEDNVEVYVENRMKLHKIYLHPDHVDEEKDRAFYTRLYHRAYHPAGFKRQLLAMICTGSLAEKLKQITIASLIIHGDYDPAFPIEHGKQLATLLPKARLEIIEKMGHGLPECLCEKIVKLMSHFYFELSR